MSKKTSRSTGKSLGFISEQEIDIWNSDAKSKVKIYQNSMTNNTIPSKQNKKEINNEEDMTIVFNTSINRLREKTRTQRSNSSSMSNRINYYEVDLRRKKQMIDIAKTRYKRMLEVRNRSFIEKKQLTKERQQFIRRHQLSVTLKASKVKYQRKFSNQTSKIWRENNQEEAMKIKEKRFRNQRLIAQRQQQQIEKKKKMVEQSHQVSEISREKLRQISKTKIMEGKNHHNMILLQQYAKGQMQRRKNTKMITIFKQKVKHIQVQSRKYQQDLQEYEKMLGRHFSNKSKNSKAASFYVTN